jgi:hypothetical protein
MRLSINIKKVNYLLLNSMLILNETYVVNKKGIIYLGLHFTISRNNGIYNCLAFTFRYPNHINIVVIILVNHYSLLSYKFSVLDGELPP